MTQAVQRNLVLMPRRPSRLVLGIGVSILAHAILLLAYRVESSPELVPDAETPLQTLVILVKPKPREPIPPPPPLARAEPVKKPRATPQSPSRQTREADEEDTSVPQTVVAVQPTPTPAPDPFYVQPAPQDKPFNVEAARAAARKIATTADPARADLPVAQFDKERDRVKPQPSKEAREIAKAIRPDCKDGIPGPLGGLLSPINLLFDKKDHGCKW